VARSIKKARPKKKAGAKTSKDLLLCYDLGGTKLRAALVTTRGKIAAQISKPVEQHKGFEGLLQDFKALADQLGPGPYRAISVASAGPLDPSRGELLDPTNFFTGNKSWGVLPLTAKLKKIFKQPVILENDAAAAALGEQWLGGHKKNKNLVAITLGTGVGIGAVANGELVRAGRGLHPEASHIALTEDRRYRCGCGNYGCIEAHLGGSHFTRHLGQKLGREVDGRQAIELAKDGEPHALAAFQEYGERLAQTVRALAVLFCAETVVMSGGFSHAHAYFLKHAQERLPELLVRYREGVDLLPELKVSRLQDDAGILGAAYVALQK